VEVWWPLLGLNVDVVVVLYSVHESSWSIIWYVRASHTTMSMYVGESSRILESSCFNRLRDAESGGRIMGLPVGLSQHFFSHS